MNSTDWIRSELEALEESQMRRRLRVRQSPHVAGIVQVDGQQLIDFGSNDYLGLSADSRLAEAVRSAALQHGWGAGASPLIHGHGVLHQKLADTLAEFKKTETVLLFPTGFAANVGCIGALVGKGDHVLSDEKNHASIIDGCRLSGANIHIYKHCDVGNLEKTLNKLPATGKKLIVTDTVFSMDGDIAPLKKICDLADQHAAMLMVDEAHATGVFGTRGSGVCELLDVEDRVPIRVGTLSKALGSVGGFVAGSCQVVDWICNRARPGIFSTAQPEAVSAAAIEAIQIVHDEPDRRIRVLQNADHVRKELHGIGWQVGASSSPIIPMVLKSVERAMQLYEQFLERGFFIPVIRPPAVPPDQPMLRLSITASHTDEQIDKLLSASRELFQALLNKHKKAEWI